MLDVTSWMNVVERPCFSPLMAEDWEEARAAEAASDPVLEMASSAEQAAVGEWVVGSGRSDPDLGSGDQWRRPVPPSPVLRFLPGSLRTTTPIRAP